MPILRTGARPRYVVVAPFPLPTPRYWSTVWSLYEGAKLAENTLKQRLRYIDQLYLFCDSKFGDHALDNAFGDKDARRLSELFDAFYIDLTSKSVLSSADVKSWDSVRAFFQFFADKWEVGDPQWRSLKNAIPQRGAVRDSKNNKIKFPRSLPAPTLKDLLAIAKPGTSSNPFANPDIQVRNWLLVLLMLLGGLRRGEVLLLTIDSLKQGLNIESGEIEYWLNVTSTDEEVDTYIDTRATRPSIKTRASHRHVPISEDFAQLIERYIAEYRIDGVGHQYLITSNGGNPLSAESITSVLREYSKALPLESLNVFRQRTRKTYISSHDLRHTCACVRYIAYAADGDTEKTMMRMRNFFGWDVKSDMPDTYARAAIQDEVQNSTSKTFDAILGMYRAKR